MEFSMFVTLWLGQKAILQALPWQEILNLEGCNTCFSSLRGDHGNPWMKTFLTSVGPVGLNQGPPEHTLSYVYCAQVLQLMHCMS